MAQIITRAERNKGGPRTIARWTVMAGAGIMLAGLAAVAGAATDQFAGNDRPTDRVTVVVGDEGIDDTTRGPDMSISRISAPLNDVDLDTPRGPDLAATEMHAVMGLEPTDVNSFWLDEGYVALEDKLVIVVHYDEAEAFNAPRGPSE